MGTNFYFMSKDKERQNKWFLPGEYEITDEPDWGYLTHLAKTSCGWLPLFQSHKNIHSISDMKKIYDDGGFQIVDEYGTSYTWDEFDERVLKFNGGVKGVAPIHKYNQSDFPQFLIDPDLPDHTPVSHFEYGNGKYSDEYFSDELGYEFTKREFC